MDIALTQRLAFKQAGITVLVAFALGTALSLGQVAIDYASENATINREIIGLLDISKTPAARIAYSNDSRLAQEFLAALLRAPAVIEAQVTSSQQGTLASVTRPAIQSHYRGLSDFLFGPRRHFEMPLFVEHNHRKAAGTLSVTVDTYVFGNYFLRRALVTLVTGFTRSLLLSLILLVLFYFMLTKPLTRVIRAISERDPRSPNNSKVNCPKGHEHDEIGVLVNVTNRQLSSIATEIAQRQQAEDRLTGYLAELEVRISARTEQLESANRRLLDSNRKLEEAKRIAVEMAQARSAFLANMSHEIRTPLNGLLGMLALSLDGPLSDEQRQQLSIAHNSGKVLVELLNDILNLSKFEAGQLDLENAPFDLASVVEETASLLSQNAATEVELTCLFDPQLPHLVVGDSKRVRQVVSNLLSNALKFTSQGRVDIVVDKTEFGVRIIVRDTGIGIAAEAQSKIFQRFTQAGVDINQQYGGTGLGLALTRRLCEAMHGQLRLETQEGVGSTFYADLPLIGTPNHQAAPNLQGRVILLSHALSGLSAQLTNLLPSWGLDFELICHDELWSFDGADLIICDDPERLEAIRAASPLAILLVSAYGKFISEQQTESLAPIEQLARPVARHALLQAIQRCLGKAQQAQATSADEPTKSLQKRVLLVEDNAVNQLVAKGMLNKLGYRVLLANHGAEALQLLQTETVDVVLMDCNMPVLDGYETTRQIRLKPELANLPIIALTANALADERERCRASGMNDYLAKPFGKDDLAAILDHWLKPTT